MVEEGPWVCASRVDVGEEEEEEALDVHLLFEETGLTERVVRL